MKLSFKTSQASKAASQTPLALWLLLVAKHLTLGAQQHGTSAAFWDPAISTSFWVIERDGKGEM